jgi:tetratricopeptide (TPR) repeat protein
LLALQYDITPPLAAFAYYNLGLILQQHEQFEAALYAYTRAVELDSRRRDAEANLGAVYGMLVGKDENVILAYPNLEGLITPIP